MSRRSSQSPNRSLPDELASADETQLQSDAEDTLLTQPQDDTSSSETSSVQRGSQGRFSSERSGNRRILPSPKSRVPTKHRANNTRILSELPGVGMSQNLINSGESSPEKSTPQSSPARPPTSTQQLSNGLSELQLLAATPSDESGADPTDQLSGGNYEVLTAGEKPSDRANTPTRRKSRHAATPPRRSPRRSVSPFGTPTGSGAASPARSESPRVNIATPAAMRTGKKERSFDTETLRQAAETRDNRFEGLEEAVSYAAAEHLVEQAREVLEYLDETKTNYAAHKVNLTDLERGHPLKDTAQFATSGRVLFPFISRLRSALLAHDWAEVGQLIGDIVAEHPNIMTEGWDVVQSALLCIIDDQGAHELASVARSQMGHRYYPLDTDLMILTAHGCNPAINNLIRLFTRDDKDFPKDGNHFTYFRLVLLQYVLVRLQRGELSEGFDEKLIREQVDALLSSLLNYKYPVAAALPVWLKDRDPEDAADTIRAARGNQPDSALLLELEYANLLETGDEDSQMACLREVDRLRIWWHPLALQLVSRNLDMQHLNCSLLLRWTIRILDEPQWLGSRTAWKLAGRVFKQLLENEEFTAGFAEEVSSALELRNELWDHHLPSKVRKSAKKARSRLVRLKEGCATNVPTVLT